MPRQQRSPTPRQTVAVLVLAAAVVLMHAWPAAAFVQAASSATTDTVHNTHRAGGSSDHHSCPDGSSSHHHCVAGAVQTGLDLGCPAAMSLGNIDDRAHDAALAATPATHHRAHGPPRVLDPVADLGVHRV